MSDIPEFDLEDEDPRLLRAVQEYMAEVEAGRSPNRRELEARFPDLAGQMAPYFEALEMLNAAAPWLHDSSSKSSRRIHAESLPAEPLGDFRIEREIGRGGMGVVYEAVQLSLGRRVALKVLPFAAALDAKQLQRFRNEAQAAAQLHHPHIVPVFGVGCERGVHFYAMQLIEGQNLAAVIHQLRREGPSDPTPLSTESRSTAVDSYSNIGERPNPAETKTVFGAQLTTEKNRRSADYFRTIARLIVQAADGLDYAHGLGIVHRDVKPANILVDDAGHVWVTDFGLAQFQTGVTLTQTGDILGTLRYMSPEQAGGQSVLIDQRTDVYSLGATLYEMLTLKPIFDGPDRNALLRQILQDEPPKPRLVDRTIPLELETIALKATGKLPAERYATMRDLADDLRRYLDNRPIRARQPSVLERLAKWSRRHRAVVASGLIALLLTLAGLTVATVLTLQAYDRERAKAQEAAEQHARAERNFQQAREAVDEFTRISEEELRNHPMLESIRLRMLEASLAYYQAFVDQHHNDPMLQSELEASRSKVESILSELTTLMGAFRYGLLQHPRVQEELELTETQREAVQVLGARWRDVLRESPRLAQDEWEQKRLVLAQEQQAEVARLLSDSQFERFTQIALQHRGPLAFREPDVVTALELSAEQRSEIRKLVDSRMEPMFGPPKGPPPDFPDRMGPKPFEKPHRREDGFLGYGHQDWDQTLESILKSLTPEQRGKWAEMIGEPFDVEVLGFPPGPPRGR